MDKENVNIPSINEQSSSIKKGSVVGLKPESIKKDILYFKEEVLQEIKITEKNLIQKNKEANDFLKDKTSLFEIKYNLLKDSINNISTKLADEMKNEEKLNDLCQTKDHLLKEVTSNKIKINFLEKETRDSINRINDLLKQSILYPGIIGRNGKFNNFHSLIDFFLKESNDNSNFRHKNIMDLSSFKMKIDKSINTLGFKIESNLVNTNAYTDIKVKDVQDKFEDVLRRYKKNLDDLRIENSDYVIQLVKDTKDIRNETQIIKSMRNEIFFKIDNEVKNMKIENGKLIEKFNLYKEDVDTLKNDVNRIEKKIEELMIEKIGLLFDEIKKVNQDLDKIKKQYTDNKNYLELKINDIKNNIKKEQIIISKNIEQINDKLNIICKNGFINSNNNFNQNIYNENYSNNYNDNISKDDKITNQAIAKGKNNTCSCRNNIKVKNLSNCNNQYANATNINKISLVASDKINENEKGQNNNYKDNFMIPSHISNLDNYNNNQLLNKRLLESLKISKIHKINKLPNSPNPRNNINIKNATQTNRKDNIKEILLSDARNENIIADKDKKVSNQKFLPESHKENLTNNLGSLKNDNTRNRNIIIKNVSSAIRSKSTLKEKNSSKYDEEKDIDYDSYIKYFKSKKIKNLKKKSFDNEKIQVLQNFQKLLKINISDVDAKLNNDNNESFVSFKIFNEKIELYDRFHITNSDDITQNLNNKNKKENDNERNYHKINLLYVYSNRTLSDKNSNDENINIKNNRAAKTTSYFYHVDKNKKIDKEVSIRPDSQKLIKFKRNNMISFMKNVNADIVNLKRDANKRPLKNNSIGKYHNYYISFITNNDNKRKKKKKIRYRSYGNINRMIDNKKDNIINNKTNIRPIKGLFINKNK